MVGGVGLGIDGALGRQVGDRCHVAGDQDEGVALAGKGAGNGEADAGTGAGDGNERAGHGVGHVSPGWRWPPS